MYRIWIIEDDDKIAEIVRRHLVKYGYEAVRMDDYAGVKARLADASDRPHLILLDINLPMYDGFYICRQIRSATNAPVIFISARVGEMDQVMAIENGGDDYITKPFHLDVLVAKIRGLLRRTYGEYASPAEPNADNRSVEEQALTKVNGLLIDSLRNELHYNGRKAELTMKEMRLIDALGRRAGAIVTREQLLEALWDEMDFVDDNTLTVNVTRVRKKLEELGLAGCIETVRGQGYRLVL
ncbi:response regulator transcription factor [Paenibacillus thermotolerans]|uniref:response regulator transcription factor n=1 Tax=Paenibacillus thermotolerans TaxID=3027807 RepID=UPI0023682205|nr:MULTISPECIES: response regulator transcription factor [unclassified Paenibacillus]